MSVYLIEDDSAVADSVAMTVMQFGHDVHVYSDGESFLDQASPGPDDLVLIDLKLPGISGRDVCDALSAREAPPRIVFISGESQSMIERKLAGLDPKPILRKPLTASVISRNL